MPNGSADDEDELERGITGSGRLRDAFLILSTRYPDSSRSVVKRRGICGQFGKRRIRKIRLISSDVGHDGYFNYDLVMIEEGYYSVGIHSGISHLYRLFEISFRLT